MPVLVEHHLAEHANAARCAASGACAALQAIELSRVTDASVCPRADHTSSTLQLLVVARIAGSAQTAGLAETLRRVRCLPIEGSDEPSDSAAEMLGDAVGALHEAALILDVARAAGKRSGLGDVAEGADGRHGELALALALWSGHIWQMTGSSDLPQVRRVAWGAQPRDDRVILVVGLTLCSCFIASGVMSLRIALADARRREEHTPAWDELHAVSVLMLSWAQEAAAGATIVSEHLLALAERRLDELALHGPPDSPGPDALEAAFVSALTSADDFVTAAKALYANAAQSPQYAMDASSREGLRRLIEVARDHESAIAQRIGEARSRREDRLAPS